jgi:hypothetical protein
MTGANAQRGVTILAWKAVHKNTLFGFATVRIERIGLVVDDVAVHQKNQSRGASLPSKPMLDRSGNVMRDEATGRIRYQPFGQWADRKVSDRFSAAVVAELLARHPDAFDDGPP